MLPERIPQLDVSIGNQPGAGQLLKSSTYEFRYVNADKDQTSVALLMPAARQLTWTDGDLFPTMDQNLPEGELFMQIRAMFPKQPTTAMHMLALIGDNGIGRLGFRIPGAPTLPMAAPMSKDDLLRTPYPGLTANEYLCLRAANLAGIETPRFDLSHDGKLLVVERFDAAPLANGGMERLGFEDIAEVLRTLTLKVVSKRMITASKAPFYAPAA